MPLLPQRPLSTPVRNASSPTPDSRQHSFTDLTLLDHNRDELESQTDSNKQEDSVEIVEPSDSTGGWTNPLRSRLFEWYLGSDYEDNFELLMSNPSLLHKKVCILPSTVCNSCTNSALRLAKIFLIIFRTTRSRVSGIGPRPSTSPLESSSHSLVAVGMVIWQTMFKPSRQRKQELWRLGGMLHQFNIGSSKPGWTRAGMISLHPGMLFLICEVIR